jgi:hypothetical protein
MDPAPIEGDPEPTVVATFVRAWEADLARNYLVDVGVPAWVETSGLDNPYRLPAGGMGLLRLYVAADRTEEARRLLAQLSAAGEGNIAGPPDRQEREREGKFRRRPLWPTAGGVAVLVVLAVTAIPHGFRVPVLIITVLASVIWSLLRRRTGSSGG